MSKKLLYTLIVGVLALPGSYAQPGSPIINTHSIPDTAKYSLDSADIKTHSLTRITENHFNQYSHISGERVNRDSTFKKINGILKLPLDFGKYYIRKDEGTAGYEDYSNYEYMGQFKSIPYYLVNYTGHETWSSILVDKQTGEESTSGFNPVLSPGGSKLAFVETYDDVDYLESPYVDLYIDNIKDKKIVSGENSTTIIIHIGNTTTFPESCDLYWQNESTLLIKLTYRDNDCSDYLRLQKSN